MVRGREGGREGGRPALDALFFPGAATWLLPGLEVGRRTKQTDLVDVLNCDWPMNKQERRDMKNKTTSLLPCVLFVREVKGEEYVCVQSGQREMMMTHVRM